MRDDRPTVREAVAAAISSGSLDRAAALGSAQMLRTEDGAVVTRRDDNRLSLKERVQLVERDGKDLGLELAALLLRAKYANDHSGVQVANFRFALRLRVRARNQVRSSINSKRLVIVLATQSIAEWLADRCEKCSGTGLRGARMGGVEHGLRPCTLCMLPNGEPSGVVAYASKGLLPSVLQIQCPDCRGMRYKPERTRVHQTLGRVCQRCGGDGEALPRHADRARAMGISLERYSRSWHGWFDWAGKHLKALDQTLVRNLRCELGRGYSSSP